MILIIMAILSISNSCKYVRRLLSLIFRASIVGVPLFFSCVFSTRLSAQDEEKLTIERTSPLIQASERFKPRPKFIEFNYETFDGFAVKATSGAIGDARARIRQNLVRTAKFKFPIILKKHLNLIGGFGYQHEQFKFTNITEPGYPLFVAFEDKPLKKISSSFYLRRNLKNKKFLFLFLNNSLNGDAAPFVNFFDQLKSSIAVIYGKQKNPNKQVGYGLSFGYDLGQPSIFPLFIFNNDLSLHWGVELILPKSAKLRYSPSNKIHFYAVAELQGASYHIQNLSLAGGNKFEFRRSSARLNLKIEREIHDWLWLGITAGYRMPLSIFVSEPGEGRKNSLIKVDAKNAAYYQFSIFMVPPAKLYKKAKGG